MLSRSLPVAHCLAIVLLAGSAPSQDPSPIFQNVSQVWVSGTPGPVSATLTGGAIPIVSGDSDTNPRAVFAAIGGPGTPGAGWVLAAGHDGLLGNSSNAELDTLQFNTQAFEWLDARGTRRLGALSGHGEFVRANNIGTLSGALTGAGWTVSNVPGVVNASALSNLDVVMVGNAWGGFTGAELDALETFVSQGGGLFLVGLGWSWGGALEDYPMNHLGARFGLGWIRGSFSDPTHNHNGSIVFHTFYPDCDLYWPQTALAHLETLLSQHSGDLDVHLRNDPQERADFLSAIGSAVSGSETFSIASGDRAVFDARMRAFMSSYPQWFGMVGMYDRNLDAALAIGRAALGGALVAAFPLEAARLAEIEPPLGIQDVRLPEAYRTCLRDHGFLILDNRQLGTLELDSILDVIGIIGEVPRDLVRMTVRDAWTTDPDERNFHIPGVGVNVFRGDGMTWQENGFPPDVTPRSHPGFSTTVVHEIAHVVDSYAIREIEGFSSKRDALLQRAGLDDLQYLRSMIGASFFQNAPQEFVASIANQWCVDSVHTMLLGLVRFGGGRQEPLAQCLMMLDLYSTDGETSPLFLMDGQGATAATTAALTKDAQGRITGVCDGTFHLQVRYNGAGEIVSAWEEAAACGSTGSFTTTQPGCGSATLSANGAPQLGGSIQYEITGMSGTNQVLWLGTSALSVPLCAGCNLGTAPALVFPAGSAISTAIPYDPFLIGAFWYIQGADLFAAAGCPFGPTSFFSLTETIRTDVGR